MTVDVSLAKLVDLAIGTPDEGNVDFSTLHTLLHIIVRKLGSQRSSVELPPDQQLEALLLRSLEKASSVQVTVQERDGRELFQVRNRSAEDDEEDEPKLSHRSSLSSVEIEDINQKLEDLERKVSILPSEQDVEQYCSRRESLNPESPLDYLSLASRLDTIEVSLGKLTATMSDVMMEFTRLEKLVLPYLDGGDIAVLKMQVENISRLLSDHFPGFRSRQPSDRQSGSRRLTIETLPVDFYSQGIPSIAQIANARRSFMRSPVTQSSASIQLPDHLEREIEAIRGVLNSLIGVLPLAEESQSSELILSKSDEACDESQTTVKANFHQKAASAIINLRFVQKEIDELFQEKEERLAIIERTQKDAAELMETLQTCVEKLKEQFTSLNDHVEQFEAEYEKKFDDFQTDINDHIKNLMSDVGYLKNDTVERVLQLEFQIEDRVDFELFKTRVPLQQFQMTIADIGRALKQHDEKLEESKASLLQLIHDLTPEIQVKVDRTELSTLERNVSKKLNLLQLRLTKFLKLQESIAAAGTKLKLSGALKCISCDHEATMNALDDIVPRSNLPLRAYPYEMDASLEARKNRFCGGIHTTMSPRKPAVIRCPRSKKIHCLETTAHVMIWQRIEGKEQIIAAQPVAGSTELIP
ncbi:hypothetical protein pipiens_009297 [Culex pipiens pipiens]|uniref:DUF4795 domain-containing protein n=1 Tax=Culex pipiens pipiens TaxID=38569 RepID=A0ABD1DEJ6_CULPP